MSEKSRYSSQLYWIGEIGAYFKGHGFGRALPLLANEFVVGKLWRVARHRVEALLGRALPLQPILEALELRPPALHLEFANICNARCVFCPIEYQKRAPQLMSEEVFRKVVEDYVRIGGGPVGLTPIVGESLVHPKFIPWVKYLRSLPVISSIFMTTNGVLLDQHGIDEFVDCGVNDVIVSIAGFDEDMYRRVHRLDDYDRVRRNVLLLLQRNNQRKQPIRIRLALRPDRPLTEVIKQPDFKPILELKPEVTFHWAFGANGLPAAEVPREFILQSKTGPRECCEAQYRGPVVLSDGTISACFNSPAPMDSRELALGNCMEDDLLSVWRGPKLKELRSRFQRNKLLDPCRTCGQYEGLDLYRTPGGRRMAMLSAKRSQLSQNSPGTPG